MADNKKYYYLKLKEDFFESDTMVLLESMKEGYLYSNILLKLYLRSLKDGGRLTLRGRIPYNPQMIASVTRHQLGTVEKALEIFQELDLIEILDNGTIYMLDVQNFVGQSSTEADRKREYRARIDSEKTDGQMSRHLSGQTPLEIRDKSIENRDKSIYIKDMCSETVVSEPPTPKKKTKITRFIPPTAEEVRRYCQENNYSVDAERFVDFYECKGWMVGKNKMKNWKAAVRTWVRQNGKGAAGNGNDYAGPSASVKLW